MKRKLTIDTKEKWKFQIFILLMVSINIPINRVYEKRVNLVVLYVTEPKAEF